MTIACYSKVKGALSHASLWMNKCFSPADLPLCLCALCVRAHTRVPPQLFLISERLSFTRSDGCQCLQSQLCVCVCVACLSAHFYVSIWLGVHACTSKCPCCWSERGVRLGEVMLRAGMLWVGLVIIVATPLVPTDQSNLSIPGKHEWVKQGLNRCLGQVVLL